jgi:hypothetical protein
MVIGSLPINTTFQVQERVLVPVAPEHCAEEGGAGGQDDFVRLQLLIIARQGHVEKVFVLPELPEGAAAT